MDSHNKKVVLVRPGIEESIIKSLVSKEFYSPDNSEMNLGGITYVTNIDDAIEFIDTVYNAKLYLLRDILPDEINKFDNFLSKNNGIKFSLKSKMLTKLITDVSTEPCPDDLCEFIKMFERTLTYKDFKSYSNRNELVQFMFGISRINPELYQVFSSIHVTKEMVNIKNHIKIGEDIITYINLHPDLYPQYMKLYNNDITNGEFIVAKDKL